MVPTGSGRRYVVLAGGPAGGQPSCRFILIPVPGRHHNNTATLTATSTVVWHHRWRISPSCRCCQTVFCLHLPVVWRTDGLASITVCGSHGSHQRMDMYDFPQPHHQFLFHEPGPRGHLRSLHSSSLASSGLDNTSFWFAQHMLV